MFLLFFFLHQTHSSLPYSIFFLFFLQHFEQTNGFDASQLLLLILDEADRILDMGFKTQLDGILQYLPPRQTMLFSATQTKSVKDLARLSLNNPQYVAVHALDKEVTPKQLLQNYVTVSYYYCSFCNICIFLSFHYLCQHFCVNFLYCLSCLVWFGLV